MKIYFDGDYFETQNWITRITVKNNHDILAFKCIKKGTSGYIEIQDIDVDTIEIQFSLEKKERVTRDEYITQFCIGKVKDIFSAKDLHKVLLFENVDKIEEDINEKKYPREWIYPYALVLPLEHNLDNILITRHNCQMVVTICGYDFTIENYKVNRKVLLPKDRLKSILIRSIIKKIIFITVLLSFNIPLCFCVVLPFINIFINEAGNGQLAGWGVAILLMVIAPLIQLKDDLRLIINRHKEILNNADIWRTL